MNRVKQHAVVVHSGTKCRSSCSFVCNISHIVSFSVKFWSVSLINQFMSLLEKRMWNGLNPDPVMFSIVNCSCVAGHFEVMKSSNLCLIFPENVSVNKSEKGYSSTTHSTLTFYYLVTQRLTSRLISVKEMRFHWMIHWLVEGNNTNDREPTVFIWSDGYISQS